MEKVEKPTPLAIKTITSSSHEIYQPVILEFDTPLTSLDTNAFRLEVMVDTVWKPVAKPWRPTPFDSVNPRRLKIEYPWEFETQYRLLADSLAAVGIYGPVSDPFEFSFKTKSEDDYSAVIFDITNFVDTVPAFVELLSTSDAPVKRVPVVNGKANLQYLAPGKYYARIFEDLNGNGVFDTGNYELLQQPDVAYYYPKVINLKKNWERTETWNVFATAVDLMKPEDIKKNKPEADKKARNRKKTTNDNTDEEDEDYYDPTNPFG